jgi:DNA-binding transcriptional regulator YhcF (GntR family)
MIITLTETGAPFTDQIQDQIRGLIATGVLAADQRLPSVRQLATDLGVAPGTVAKAYKALESEKILVTRTGSGTRVSDSVSATPRAVLTAAHRLVAESKHEGLSRSDAMRVLGAIWPD